MPTKFSWTKILAVTLVMGASLSLGLGVLEFAYRLYHNAKKPPAFQNPALAAYDDPEQFYNRTPGIARMQYDSYLSYIPQASFTGIDYHINAHHFRSDEDFPVEKPAGERRIFVTGGSTAFGVGVHQNKLYAVTMERLLKEKQPGVPLRVISAAAGGWCTTQERILIENRLYRFSPDLVIMLSGWNDTYFGYRGKHILEDNDFVGFRDRLEKIERGLHPLEPPDYPRYSLKLHYLWDKARYHQKYPSREVLEEKIHENTVPPREVVDTVLHNVQIVADFAARRHFKLIYALQPCVYSTRKPLAVWEKTLVTWGEENEIGFPTYLDQVFGEIRTRLAQGAQASQTSGHAGFTFLDLDESIVGEKRAVFLDTVHLGDRGNDLMAKYLVEQLTRMENKNR